MIVLCTYDRIIICHSNYKEVGFSNADCYELFFMLAIFVVFLIQSWELITLMYLVGVNTVLVGRNWWLKRWVQSNNEANIRQFHVKMVPGEPRWFTWLNVRLWLRSWSHGSRVWAPCRALCCQLGTWSLLWILSPSLSLCPSPMHALARSFKNK